MVMTPRWFSEIREGTRLSPTGMCGYCEGFVPSPRIGRGWSLWTGCGFYAIPDSSSAVPNAFRNAFTSVSPIGVERQPDSVDEMKMPFASID